VASIPVFLSGFVEDLNRKVKPFYRLIFAFVSAALGIYLVGALLTRVDIIYIDKFLTIKAIAILVTLIAVGGVTNAFNIIDGFNGLVSVVSMFIFLGLGFVSFKVGDMFLVYICFTMIFAISGFFILNYPYGKIFLGDGGAYFVGFIVATVSILLVERHRQVSAFFPLLLCIYPIFETIFSMYRRKIIRRGKATKADGLHLHTLIYKRVTNYIFGPIIQGNRIYRNSLTSLFLWFLCVFSLMPAILFWNNKLMLAVFTVVFILVYLGLYKSIINFKVGKYLKLEKIKKIK
ncbi:MAG: glycosyltransferase, partial [Candidatus Parvarchaeota archaeon]